MNAVASAALRQCYFAAMPTLRMAVINTESVDDAAGLLPWLTGNEGAANLKVQAEILQGALKRLLQEQRPDFERIAIVRSTCYSKIAYVGLPAALWTGSMPEDLATYLLSLTQSALYR